MKLLHMSDSHIGGTVTAGTGRGRGHNRYQDFAAVLAEVVGIAEEAQPDLILHTGDLFDRQVPSPEDFALGMSAMVELSAIAPTVVIRGNHDSPLLFQALDGMAAFNSRNGVPALRFVAQARPSANGGILDYPARDGQRIRLAALPFVHRNRAVEGFDRPDSATLAFADYLRGIQADLAAGLRDGYAPTRDVLIFAAHMYVESALPDYSERRLDISSDYASATTALPAVSYAALGHIHKPQAISRPGLPARYAGSLLQMDFGEITDGQPEQKSVVIIDANPGRPPKIDIRLLRKGRKLITFTGGLDALARQAPLIGDAFVKAYIDVPESSPGLAAAVTELLPGATLVEVQPRLPGWDEQRELPELDHAAAPEPDLPDLFAEYLVTTETIPEHAELLRATFTELLTQSRPDFNLVTDPVETLLRTAVASSKPSTIAP
ncbi:metallophosphoesterase family protein [Spirillospora sp. CA-142024]|uniref:metallophosphoesterase family protein n=1 Tax=Spirillospora sp. CA-142024 TaxID=3240036 RepID=UPI003D8B504F